MQLHTHAQKNPFIFINDAYYWSFWSNHVGFPVCCVVSTPWGWMELPAGLVLEGHRPEAWILVLTVVPKDMAGKIPCTGGRIWCLFSLYPRKY